MDCRYALILAALLASGIVWLTSARAADSAANPLPVRLDLNLPEGVEAYMSTSSVAFSPMAP